ncbi:hypothetical protein BH11GEM1_BH11GEM1_27770 [soil metagenome]
MRRLAALLGLAALAACSTDIDQSTRPDNLAGTYHLVSLAGAPLPAATTIDTVSAQLVSGDLVLTADGMWTETLSLTTASPTGVKQLLTSSGAGTWVILRDFAYIAFTDRINAYSFSGIGSGNMVVLKTVGGQEMVYRR